MKTHQTSKKLIPATLFLILSTFITGHSKDAIDIGSRLELMVDDYLIEQMTGDAELRLHKPIPHEIAIVHNEPWEGNSCGAYTIFKDNDLFRMYYMAGSQVLKGEPEPHKYFACYAESKDGIHWINPDCAGRCRSLFISV